MSTIHKVSSCSLCPMLHTASRVGGSYCFIMDPVQVEDPKPGESPFQIPLIPESEQSRVHKDCPLRDEAVLVELNNY